ncbi:unnamed protein product [Moneuplotes crassus]|uniref:Uncharacterized protein n=1 Tax=Euplotes crassus TaxID=5936 RepID=A0AAD2D9Y8_EUPCR|nr:unnamed protein product [Moneuplotes crassus]
MTRLGDLEEDQPNFKKLKDTVEMHNETILRMVHENDALKTFVRTHFTKAEDLLYKNTSQLENKFEFIFKSELKDFSTKDYVQDRLCDKANASDMVRLNREVRMLESYVSKLEKVVFQGYKKEAEVFLNGKVDKEVFEQFKTIKNTESEGFSKFSKNMNNTVDKMSRFVQNLDGDLKTLNEKFKQSEALQISRNGSLDLSSEDTVDFAQIDYDSITQVPVNQIAKKILKPMYQAIKGLKRDFTENMSDLMNEKEQRSSRQLNSLAQQHQNSQRQISTCMNKLEDLLAEKEETARNSQKFAKGLESLSDNLKAQERKSKESLEKINKKLMEHDISLQELHQKVDFVKISKEKLFEEVCNNLDDLIRSKFSLSTKLQNSDLKLSQMVLELEKKQITLENEVEQSRQDYEITISNLQNETESYSQELQRMQAYNRELVDKLAVFDSGMFTSYQSSQCNKDPAKSTFLTEDATPINDLHKSYSRPTKFSRGHERSINHVCQHKRRMNSDFTTSKRPLTTNNFRKPQSRMRFKGGLGSSHRSSSTKRGNKTTENNQSFDLRVNKFFTKSKGFFQKFETILTSDHVKLESGPKTTSGRRNAKKTVSTAKSRGQKTNFIENSDISKKNLNLTIEEQENNMLQNSRLHSRKEWKEKV